jgi:hypothetical protein
MIEVLLGLDELGNALLLKGSSKETISSNLGKRLVRDRARGIAYGVVAVLDLLDEHHCLDAIDWAHGLSFEDVFGKYIHHRSDCLH